MVVSQASGEEDAGSGSSDASSGLETWEIALISGSGALALLMLMYAAYVFYNRPRSSESSTTPVEEVVIDIAETAKEQKDRIVQTVTKKAEAASGKVATATTKAATTTAVAVTDTAKKAQTSAITRGDKALTKATKSTTDAINKFQTQLEDGTALKAKERVSSRRKGRI
jgi:hypothetical protein